MRLQIVQDGKGNNTGIFIPIEDWNVIKNQYPDIEKADKDLPHWEQELLDKRLDDIAKNPKRLKSGKNLFTLLKG